jgi:hypothetical protein
MTDNDNEKQLALTKFTEQDYDNNNHPFPAVRDRAISEIEQYLTIKKRANISDIARQLDVRWDTAEKYVSEITERWRKQDLAHLSDYRKRLTEMADTFISDAEKEAVDGKLALNKMKDMISLFRDISSITKLEDRPVDGAIESGQVVAVHFNNMNLTPAMMKEMDRIKNSSPESVVKIVETAERPQVELNTTAEPIPVVEVEAQPVITTENTKVETENGSTTTTDNTTPGYSGSEPPIV